MEDLETNLIQTRKACRIEQMVAKWLHRSRDGASRGSVPAADGAGDGSGQPAGRVQLAVTVYKDLLLRHYGFEICPNLPLTIASVTAGSTAEGKLQPGDQLLLINSTAVDNLSVEQAADIIREAGDELLLTVLRCTSGGPKSSFLTAEKRARLKTNPVKVRFAEEVLVNGHAQGNSLLCMPNVLKVYLENGQTKAFRFETSTTVKDIVLTLKEKLSIRSILHFALALEEQYNVAKIHLLHEEELIEQVVQKRESHDYRCLFRVCFVPKDPLDLLQEDPVAFEYLYLQSCSDVLQERFAVEMKCSVALRLAALHIQERICACAQPQKVSFKYIERDWGIENFISPTLLRNMRGKDIKKAISYHMKRNQLLLDPRQKHTLAAVQVRLSYLQILGDLKMYNGRIFNATLMLQDRESYVALLVGAKYGVSQIINNKLNIVTSLAEFANISRVELAEESEKVSTVKIYLQDLKLLTLLLESNSAKDLVCLIIGYYRLFVNANVSIFTWGEKKQQLHRVSAEEGYESRTCSDSEDSWELDSCSEQGPEAAAAPGGARPACEAPGEPRSPDRDRRKERPPGADPCDGGDNATDSTSEASDSANTESRGFKTSGSSDSMDALEEDELEACSSSRPELFHFYMPTVQEMSSSDKSFLPVRAAGGCSGAGPRDYFCFLQVPLTEEPGHDDDPPEQRQEDISASALGTKLSEGNTMGYYSLCYSTSPAESAERSNTSHSPQRSPWRDLSAQEDSPCGAERTAERTAEGTAERTAERTAEGTAEGTAERTAERTAEGTAEGTAERTAEGTAERTAEGTAEGSELTLEPPPGFGDTSSEEEFYDAADRLSPPEARAAGYNTSSREGTDSSCTREEPGCDSSGQTLVRRQTAREKHRREKELTCANSPRKRRSFLQTDYTSQVTFPLGLPGSVQNRCSWPPPAPLSARPPAPPSAGDTGEDAELGLQAQGDTSPYSDLVEMEPDAMETKSVTEWVVSPISAVRLPGEQHGEGGAGGGPQPALPAHPPLLSLPGAQNRAAQECPSTKTDAEWASGESCVATSRGLVRVALEEAGDTSPSAGQALPCPASERTALPPARGPRAAAPRERAQQQEPVAPAGGQGVCAEPVPAPCEERKAAPDSSDSALSQAKSRQAISMEALWKAHKKTCVGFPDATQLLTDCSSTSGVITRLSWLSLRVRTDPTSPSPSQGRADTPPELSASQTSGCLGADAVGTETQTCPAGPPFETELVGHGVDEGQPGSGAGDVADEQPRPVQRLFPPERTPEAGRGSAPSLGLPASSGPAPLGSLGRSAGGHGASQHSFLCFNHQDEPSDAITTGPSGFSAEKTPPAQLGVDKCSCQLSYISCFHRPDDQGEGETPVPACRALPGPLTAAPPRRRSLPGTPLRCGDVARQGPPARALGWLNDRAQMSPADLSCFLGYTAELQELVGELSGSQATHPQEHCAEQRAESKAALGTAARRLLSRCQGLLSTQQPPRELQRVLRATFGHLVQLAEASLQVSRCPRCRQGRRALGAALLDVVGAYRQLLQAAEPRLHGPGRAGPGARLLSCQHTALAAAAFCLLQQL